MSVLILNMSKYQHYKGGVYTYLGTALNKETDNETWVVYTDAHGNYYIRTTTSFFGSVVVDGKPINRFTRLTNPYAREEAVGDEDEYCVSCDNEDEGNCDD